MSELGWSYLFLLFSGGGGAPILLFSGSYAALSFPPRVIAPALYLLGTYFQRTCVLLYSCICFILYCILFFVLFVVFLIVSGFVLLLRIIAWSELWPLGCMASFLASLSLRCSGHLTARTKLDSRSCLLPGFLILF